MNFFIGRLYSIYALTVFAILFLLVFPFQILFSFHIGLHKAALWLNAFVARGFFIFMLVPLKIHGKGNIPKGQVIICSNHFSYLDIPALCLIGSRFKFFGKNSLAKIPFFGWMYQRLHVTVDRASFKSRAHALSKGREMMEKGFNMAFFPEGGVRLTNYPEMAVFRDGAFRLAVEFQVPIVPVTMNRNQEVWPYDKRQLFFGGRADIFIHAPVYPKGKTEEEIVRLKNEVREVMQTSLNEHAVGKAVNIAIS